MTDILADDLLTLTADIVSAHVSFNKVDATELSSLIGSVHAALGRLGKAEAEAAPARPEPAVPVSASVRPDHLVCLDDGMKLKTLKRHLASCHGLTPAEYRERWGLRPDYPMVAPNYAKRRQDIALEAGLGRRGVREATPNEALSENDRETEVTESPKPAQAAPVEAAATGAAPAQQAPAPRPADPEEKAAPDGPPVAEAPAATEAPRKRRTLTARFGGASASSDAAPGEPLSPRDLLCRAIATKTCVTATYNKQQVVLAPHVVFTRHDEPFMRGVTVERDGKPPAAVKLSTFRLTGLVNLQPTNRRFMPNPVFERNDPEYEGTTICIA